MKTSKGILESINLKSKEVKSLDFEEDKNSDIQEETIKRSYALKKSTVQMLDLLQDYGYDNKEIQLSEIVDDAIRVLYKEKKERIKEGIEKLLSKNLL